MIPHGFPCDKIQLLPPGEARTVIITPAGLRHDWFACRLIEALGKSAVAWYRLEQPQEKPAPGFLNKIFWPVKRRLRSLIPQADPDREINKTGGMFYFVNRVCRRLSLGRRTKEFLAAECERLKAANSLAPEAISKVDEVTLARIKEKQPYFIVASKRNLLPQQVINLAGGVALTVHPGWLPDYDGANAIDWACYHRDYSKIGSSVVLAGEGPQPIIWQGQACLMPGENLEHAFIRNFILGAELMLQAIGHIRKNNGSLNLYNPPPGMGRYHEAEELTSEILYALNDDFKNGRLNFAFDSLRKF